MGKLIKRMTRELMSAIDHIVAVEGENDALRAERVQLQAENEALAHDLKLVQTQLGAASRPSGPKLDDRDRELPPGGIERELCIGDRVLVSAGAKSFGGFSFNSRKEWYVTALRTPKAYDYAVRIGRQPDIALGFWVRPEDLTRVMRVEEPRE